nr:MAG TPA: hypothetical protein [Caudoviricetes sp.]
MNMVIKNFRKFIYFCYLLYIINLKGLMAN